MNNSLRLNPLEMTELKAVFVHDHRFLVSESGEVFSPGKLPYDVFQRYLQFFNELTVIGRTRNGNEQPTDGMNKASGSGVSFEFVPNISDPHGMMAHQNEVRRTLCRHIEKADAVICRTSLLGYLAASLARRMGKPWATEVVGCAWDAIWNYGSWKGRVMAPMLYLWQKRTIQKAPYAIYVTREFLQNRYPCSGQTAGVSDVNIPSIEPDTIGIRMGKAGKQSSPLVFGLIGSLQSKWKGVQTALKAFGAIAHRLPQFELRILGDGDKDRWIKMAISHGIEDNVKFVGTLPSGEKVFQWLDDIDIYLQPSLQEGLPRSLVEAMSRGCPAVGSTAGGIPELLPKSVLHRPKDDRRLSELLMLGTDPHWRLEQARRNFETASNYTEVVLEDRRNAFWDTFYEHVRGRK